MFLLQGLGAQCQRGVEILAFEEWSSVPVFV